MNLKSIRLKTIASLVRKDSVFADVGTDHAYIPLYLISMGICRHGYAGDVRQGPLNKAGDNIRQNSAKNAIELILCSGLKAFPLERIDDIIIAGMGGDTIIEILSEEKRIGMKHRFILQPMTNVPKVRSYLLKNGYDIQKERLAKESDKIYNIIVAQRSGSNKQAEMKDIYFGVNLEETDDVKDYINLLKKKYRFHLSGLKSAMINNKQEIEETEKIISMLEEL